MVMALEDLTPEEILKTELGTGVPFVYELTEDGKVVSKEQL